MSFNNKKIIEVKSPIKLTDSKNYNIFNILNNENISIRNEIIKGNELITKLKKKIFNNEQEKKELLLTNDQKDKEIKEIKNKLEETKDKINKIKDKIKKLEENELKNNNLEINELNDDIHNTIIKLQNKLRELEFQLKNKKNENNKAKIFIHLEKKRSISMLYKNIKNKNNIIKEINHKDDLFLTGRNEAKEFQEKNIILECKLNKIKINLNNIEIKKNNLLKLLEEYKTEKKKILLLLNEKNEKINKQLIEGTKLNNNIMKQLIENKKYNDLLFQTKLKKQNLEKEIIELENIIFKQKNKINELTSSIDKITEILNNKNDEIISNHNYIIDLENNIRELNKKFIDLKHNKYIYNNKNNNIKKEELPKLLEEIEELKKEYINLIEKNKLKPKLEDKIRINYNIINNSGNTINNISYNKNYKNILEKPENKIKLYNNNNYHSRNYFNEINKNISVLSGLTKRKKLNNLSSDLLNKQMINNFNYKKYNNNDYNNVNNYNKIKINNRNSNSMRNIKIKNKNINNFLHNHKLLKNINIRKDKKMRYNSMISINDINDSYKKRNMKSFSGIENNNYLLEDQKINEFKDLLDKIINDFEK